MTSEVLGSDHVLTELEARIGRPPTHEEEARIARELGLIEAIDGADTISAVVTAADRFRAEGVTATFALDAVPNSYALFALSVHHTDSMEHRLNPVRIFRTWAPSHMQNFAIPLRVEVADQDVSSAREILIGARPELRVGAWADIRPRPMSWFPDSDSPAEVSPEVWSRFANGELGGVRNMDDAGFADLHADFRPQSVMDLAVLNATYRPSQIHAGTLAQLLERREQPYEPIVLHDALDEVASRVLEPTYGVVVFQEQIQYLLEELLGIQDWQAYVLYWKFGMFRTHKDVGFLRQLLQESAVVCDLSESALYVLISFLSASVDAPYSKAHALGEAWLTLGSAAR